MKNIELKRISVFLFFTFAITYAWTIFLIWPRTIGVDITSMNTEYIAVNTALTALLMFFPAIGVLVTRLVTGEGFKNSMLRLNLRGNLRYYLIAWFGPMFLTLLGAIVYYLLFPSKFSLNTFNVFIQQGGAMALLLMLVSPLLNLFACFGEEWGWRGYLLPKMAERTNFLSASMFTGLVWGLWHAPIIVTGHNYGVDYPCYPWLGIAAMCLFCVVIGVFFSYMTLRVRSCWPAVLAHGAINGTAAIGILFYNSGLDTVTASSVPLPEGLERFVGPLPVGIIGGIAYIAVALWIIKIVNDKKKD